MQKTGLEKWNLEACECLLADAALQREIIAHPAFPEAQRRVVAAALAFSDENGKFQSSISDLGSFFLCCLTFYLAASGGITHRRLRELVGGSGIVSAGRASAVLWRLRRGGFIEADETGGLVPAALMRASFQARIRLALEALSVLEPGLTGLLAQLDSPPVFKALVLQLGADLLHLARNADPRLREFHTVTARTHGWIVMYAVALEGAAPPVAALARRFNVSRSHVLRLLRLMEGFGYLETRGEERVATPAFHQALALFQGLVFAAQMRAAHRALQALA